MLFIGFWFLIQVLAGITELLIASPGGGVAWWAHVGGFIAGLILTPFIRQPVRNYRAYYADEGILGFNRRGLG
jgi:membrane associated rhomboid family serine protease